MSGSPEIGVGGSVGAVGQRPTQDDLVAWMQELSNWGTWGDEDERGTLNTITPEATRRAAGLVRSGEAISCAQPWDVGSTPVRPDPFDYHVVEVSDRDRPGAEEHRDFASDYVGVRMHSLAVTHLDSLAHASWDNRMYNGFPSSLVDDRGAGRLGVGSAGQGVVTRGILVDVPRLRGVDGLEPGEGMGVADLDLALAECGVEPEPGDVLLFRAGQPNQRCGPLPEVLPRLREASVAVVGSDTANDVRPSGYPRFPNPFHQVGIVAMGLWVLDAAWLEDLAEACVRHQRWEFLFTMGPLPIRIATGSPVNPIAVF
jgi:hypothetical protein